MQILKKCEICGNEFVADRRNAKYCSKVCYKQGNNETTKYIQAEKAAEKARKKEAEAKRIPIWKINEEARKLGMSYGQYQAMIYREMMKG